LDEFYVNGIFSRGCNASFIALIPKVTDPQLLNDYRPISLIGCIYKIVVKLLANRLKKVMSLIIDGKQSAFIEGRHLLHSALIANKVDKEAKRSQKSCIVFKVDYKKAYDDAVFLVWSWLSNLDKDFKLPFNLWSSHIREGFLGYASVAPSRSCGRSLVLFCSHSMVPLQTGVVFNGTMSMELSLYFFSTSGTFINILFLLIKKKQKKKKAYDSVSWDFLFYMLKRMGFCSKWIQWIEGCLKSASISVLVNGSPSSEFIPQRGLRQGDPLAPLLFNIVAEALNGLVRKAIGKNLFRGFPVGSNKVEISILQYADDTIFFGEASMENVKAIK